MSAELVIRVTALQVTVLPLPNSSGGFVATIAASLTAEPGAVPRAAAPPRAQASAEPPRFDDRAISDAQRRMLWRLAMQLGHEGPAVSALLRQRLGVRDIAEATKADASRLITALEAEVKGKENGHAAP